MQIPLGPIAQLRLQKTDYDLELFAIVPWGAELRFVSTEGDMIYVHDKQLQLQISDLLVGSTAFSSHWTGRHEVISSLGQWQNLGRQVVVSVCGEVSVSFTGIRTCFLYSQGSLVCGSLNNLIRYLRFALFLIPLISLTLLATYCSVICCGISALTSTPELSSFLKWMMHVVL